MVKKGIGRKDINYGAGIVIEAVAATDVTQTKVSMHLNHDDFSGYIFHNFLGLSKARKQERYVKKFTQASVQSDHWMSATASWVQANGMQIH